MNNRDDLIKKYLLVFADALLHNGKNNKYYELPDKWTTYSTLKT